MKWVYTLASRSIKKENRVCGYLESWQSDVGRLGICLIAKGNLDAEEVVA